MIENWVSIVVVFGVLSIPYSYVLVRVMAFAYFQAKLDHHSNVLRQFRKEDLYD